MASGGFACVAGVALIVLAFPQLAAFDVERAEANRAVEAVS
jgi:hypothetical protein